MMNPSLAQYKESQVASASPEKTVLMLYDGAVRFLNTAVKELRENDNIPEKALMVEKAVKIIEYLQSCLDKEKGGEISENLDKLYNYMAIKLTEANLKNDADKIEEVIGLLSTVREGWSNICEKKSGNDISKQNAAYGSTGIQGKMEPEMARPAGGLGIKV